MPGRGEPAVPRMAVRESFPEEVAFELRSERTAS